MKKIKEILNSVWKAARYSFAFCLRHNKRDTIIAATLLLIQTLLGYGMILIMGHLVSTIQIKLTDTTSGPMTVREFMDGKYYFPILLFVTALLLEIVIQKYQSFISTRQRQVLRVANILEMNSLRASLDIGRKRSKQYDDIEKKIDELPNGWYTRIAFAGEVITFIGILTSLMVFGMSLFKEHSAYVLILVGTSIPMMFAEFIAVSRKWKLSLDFIPHHKKRGMLQSAFYGVTSFLQGRMFNQMPTLAAEIKENFDHVNSTLDRLRWQNLQITLVAYIVAIAGLSLVLIHSVYNTMSVAGDIGVLTVVIASSRRLQSSIREIVLQIATEWLSVKGIIIIEEEYFGMKPLLQTPNPVTPEFGGTPTIRFDKVCFSYPEKDSLVLKNITFEANPGDKIVIVGKNGSGKSSLIGLLLRQYDPTSGDVRANDVNLHNIEPSYWYNYICALLQEFTILDRKIGAEIASSKLDEPIDMEKVMAASKFAGFTSVVESDPKGYDSQIGTEFDGREFSGGEEQRLALARVRYRNTPILILDEPDSRLDAEAANKLISNVFALTETTVIIVTQNIARAIKSDKVILLDQGEIAEIGTHAELLAKGGKYTTMFTNDKQRSSA